jgi:hypothetical protein
MYETQASTLTIRPHIYHVLQWNSSNDNIHFPKKWKKQYHAVGTILKFNRIFIYFLLLILYMVEICTNYQKIILKLFVLSISLTWKDYWYLHTHGWVNNSSEIRKKHIILELNREIFITTATFL